MATGTRKPQKNSRRSGDKRGPAAFFTDPRFLLTTAVVLFVITFYLTIAFISFLFSGDADQSKLDIKWHELVFNPEIKVENKAGKTGAWLADVIINRGFGISAFIFLYLLLTISFGSVNFNGLSYKDAIPLKRKTCHAGILTRNFKLFVTTYYS